MPDDILSHACATYRQFIDAELAHGCRFYAAQVWIGDGATIYKRGLGLTRDALLSERRCWVIEVMPDGGQAVNKPTIDLEALGDELKTLVNLGAQEWRQVEELAMSKDYCPRCGAVLEDDQVFCDDCALLPDDAPNAEQHHIGMSAVEWIERS